MTPLIFCGCVQWEGDILFVFLLVDNHCVIRVHQNSGESSIFPNVVIILFSSPECCPLASLSPHSPLASAFQAFKQFLVQITERIGRLNMIKEAQQFVSSDYFQMLNGQHTLSWRAERLGDW